MEQEVNSNERERKTTVNWERSKLLLMLRKHMQGYKSTKYTHRMKIHNEENEKSSWNNIDSNWQQKATMALYLCVNTTSDWLSENRIQNKVAFGLLANVCMMRANDFNERDIFAYHFPN